MRPRDDDEPEPRDDEEPPPPPPPPVSTPDFALQIRAGLGATDGCLEPAAAESLRAAVADQMRQQFPDADVRQACVTTPEGISASTVGVWTRPATGAAGAARDRGLGRLSAIHPGEQLAIFVNAGFVRGRVQEQFATTPKRYNGLGNPSGGGPIHITGYDLQFRSTDDVEGRIVLRVFGYDERPWPDVSFTITYTDVLRVIDFAVTNESLEPDQSDDRGVLNYITSVLLGIVTFAFPPLVFLTMDVLSAVLQQPSGVNRTPSIGAPIVRSFFPDAVLTPGGGKLDMLYSRIAVGGGGIVAGGVALPAERAPRCSIAGPDRVAADFREGTVLVQLTVHVFEMRGALTVEWTTGDTTLSLAVREVLMPFTFRTHREGSRATRDVQVRVVDVDGVVATASRTIEFRFVDQQDDDVPLRCRAKPWLCDDTDV